MTPSSAISDKQWWDSGICIQGGYSRLLVDTEPTLRWGTSLREIYCIRLIQGVCMIHFTEVTLLGQRAGVTGVGKGQIWGCKTEMSSTGISTGLQPTLDQIACVWMHPVQSQAQMVTSASLFLGWETWVTLEQKWGKKKSQDVMGRECPWHHARSQARHFSNCCYFCKTLLNIIFLENTGIPIHHGTFRLYFWGLQNHCRW